MNDRTKMQIFDSHQNVSKNVQNLILSHTSDTGTLQGLDSIAQSPIWGVFQYEVPAFLTLIKSETFNQTRMTYLRENSILSLDLWIRQE